MPQLGLTNQLPQMTRDVVCVLYFEKGPYTLVPSMCGTIALETGVVLGPRALTK